MRVLTERLKPLKQLVSSLKLMDNNTPPMKVICFMLYHTQSTSQQRKEALKVFSAMNSLHSPNASTKMSKREDKNVVLESTTINLCSLEKLIKKSDKVHTQEMLTKPLNTGFSHAQHTKKDKNKEKVV